MLSARCIGIAGSGKTQDALSVLEKVRATGYNPYQMAFVTLTRSARREAAQRAAELFDTSLNDLERSGWFRTVHSVCYRQLEADSKSILSDNAESVKWISGAVGEEVDPGDTGEDSFAVACKGMSAAAVALRLWDLARGTLRPFEDVYQAAEQRGGLPHNPPLEYGLITEIIEKYEAAKQSDGRTDFTDLLLDYCGLRMTLAGPEQGGPGGPIPDVPVWIIDESQDNSALMHAALTRMTANAVWLYLYGDLHQTIYSFCGADYSHFMDWPVEKERSLLKSHRCPSEILAFGKRILEQNSGWGDNPWELATWEPCREGGEIAVAGVKGWTELVDPLTPTLVMSRTNEGAYGMGKALSAANIPWQWFKRKGGFSKLSAVSCCETVAKLLAGETIPPANWREFIAEFPVGTAKGPPDLIQRGFKSGKQLDSVLLENPAVAMGRLSIYGCTQKLIQGIRSGEWTEWVDGAERAAAGVAAHGYTLMENPQVKVATIHGCKGAQADDVFLSTEIPFPVEKAIMVSGEALDEERRLYYVGATRAKQRLALVRGDGWELQQVYDAL